MAMYLARVVLALPCGSVLAMESILEDATQRSIQASAASPVRSAAETPPPTPSVTLQDVAAAVSSLDQLQRSCVRCIGFVDASTGLRVDHWPVEERTYAPFGERVFLCVLIPDGTCAQARAESNFLSTSVMSAGPTPLASPGVSVLASSTDRLGDPLGRSSQAPGSRLRGPATGGAAPSSGVASSQASAAPSMVSGTFEPPGLSASTTPLSVPASSTSTTTTTGVPRTPPASAVVGVAPPSALVGIESSASVTLAQFLETESSVANREETTTRSRRSSQSSVRLATSVSSSAMTGGVAGSVAVGFGVGNGGGGGGIAAGSSFSAATATTNGAAFCSGPEARRMQTTEEVWAVARDAMAECRAVRFTRQNEGDSGAAEAATLPPADVDALPKVTPARSASQSPPRRLFPRSREAELIPLKRLSKLICTLPERTAFLVACQQWALERELAELAHQLAAGRRSGSEGGALSPEPEDDTPTDPALLHALVQSAVPATSLDPLLEMGFPFDATLRCLLRNNMDRDRALHDLLALPSTATGSVDGQPLSDEELRTFYRRFCRPAAPKRHPTPGTAFVRTAIPGSGRHATTFDGADPGGSSWTSNEARQAAGGNSSPGSIRARLAMILSKLPPAVSQLVDMGFPPAPAMRVLRHAGGDVEEACAVLFGDPAATARLERRRRETSADLWFAKLEEPATTPGSNVEPQELTAVAESLLANPQRVVELWDSPRTRNTLEQLIDCFPA